MGGVPELDRDPDGAIIAGAALDLTKEVMLRIL